MEEYKGYGVPLMRCCDGTKFSLISVVVVVSLLLTMVYVPGVFQLIKVVIIITLFSYTDQLTR